MAPLNMPKILRWILGILFFFLLFMFLYRILFFYSYRVPGRPVPGSAFLLGFRFDMRVVSSLGLFVLLLSYIPFLNPIRRSSALTFWRFTLGFVFLLFLVFYGADYYHYDYLQQRLNASALGFLEDAGISFRMIWQTYPVFKILFAILVGMLLFLWYFKKISKRLSLSVNRSRGRKIGWHAGAILLFSLLVFGQAGQYPLRWSDAFRFADDFKANVALNPFQSFLSTLQFRHTGVNMPAVKAAYPVMHQYLELPVTDSILNFRHRVEFGGDGNKPNVVIVICESFSAYKSSMFGNKLDPTPYFNNLCNKGAFFERCFVPAFGTARGVWAVLTGIPDVESPKTASRNPLAVDQHTILNDFKEYNKMYFLGGSTTWANIRGVLTNNIDNLQIFEEDQFKANKVDVWGISDKNLFLEANKVFREQQQPFISIIQTADNHRPYTIPVEDLPEFKKVSYPADTLRKYGFAGNDELNAFRYTDFSFRKFFEAAQKEKYFSNTIFVFVGDHGLRGDAGDMFPSSFTRQGILSQHVPLLFYSPALLPPARIREVSSQLDILPSVAVLARQSYTNSTLGINLFDSSRQQPRYAFIADPDLNTIGVVGDKYYYRQNQKTLKEEFVPVTNNEPVATNLVTDSLRNYMRLLTVSWYQTSKYLLLHNKKTPGQ